MQLSWYASVSKNRENQKLRSFRSRKKHKRLEAICEKAYNRSHKGVGVGLSDCNGRDGTGGDELELRRSTRVRKAPAVLDASPLPAKKRRKIDFVERVKNESVCSTSRDLEGELVNWTSRLRSRARIVSSSPKGKKKLFEDLDGFKEKDKKGGWYGEMFTVVKSKRSGRIEASAVSRNGHEDGKGDNRVDVLEDKNDDSDACGSEGEMKDTDAVTELEDEKVSEVPKECNDNVLCMEEDNQMEQPNCLNNGENQRDDEEVRGVPNDTIEDEGCHDQPLKNLKKVDKMSSASGDPLRKPRIKKGRRCDLCGRGTDGKPPKKLLQNGAETDNEAYSGSSASEEPTYDIWDGFGDGPGWLGNLLGPINDRHGIAGIWVHHYCAIWSPEVYFAGIGRLKNVRAALCRGRVLKCSRCGRRGATIGCRVDRCPKTYHLPCARVNGCIFDHHKFLVACTDHRRLFQPQGSKYFDWLKKMKARKMKLTMKKSSNDACRNDIEEEEKWLENCGEDEEFLKRESKRLHRDLLRIAPVYIGGSKSESESQFQGWESVAGLQEVIQCLKEVVILPLLYPDFFSNLGLTPPRGVLLHGYPGTGKTLVVRALIGSCARGDKRIAYFARKGADCLGKYVGDAERQLRLLFQVAEKSQPSIIFFDEIDGLAPPRTRQQDQTHSSVVSTLLALMDGLKSRGSVVVIGATNRPDAVDPALRRPGRFDREIYFPLPSFKDREAILALHTQKWPKPVTGALLKWIARKTVGFAGADLQALCTQAAIAALKRSCPLQKLLSAAGEKAPHAKLPPLPSFVVEERDWLKALSCAPPPCSQREAGMAANDVVSSPLPAHLMSCLLQPLSSLLVSFYLDERVWLPTPLSKAAKLIETVIISALEKRKARTDYWWFHVHDLLQEADVASEIETNLSRVSILVGDASFSTFDASDGDPDDDSLGFEPSNVQHRVTHTSLARNINNESRNKSGLRILISGNPRTGQRHLASSILHCFVGNVEIQKVDLATIQQEGHGDEVQGVTQILKRCANVGSCMMFMPRINLWAMEACYRADKRASDCPSTNLESSEESQSCLTHSEDLDKENKSCPRMSESTDMGESKVADLRSSRLWNSFVEQVESICVSTSLMILATSEVSFTLLPPGIRQFFGSDILNCSPSTPLVDTVPRFSIEVDGSFERDVVINSSAAKLSKDLAQYFVQLIHHRNHVCVSSFKEDKVCDTTEGDADTVCHNLDPVSLVTRGSPPHNKKSLKGKTSLLLEISTFGYQILQYPHFAELCWVSSKLKEGPCADISGPWKGWPFNSCITRPIDSLEKTAVACSSSNINNTDKIGFVRGLIAVGLSAYRGVYTSLKEFTSEVQNVLKLLSRYINAKIQSRRDRYQFTYLLSQVAYLDDMVNIWAYKLQSLEADAQATDSNPKPTWEGSLDKYNPCKDNVIRSDICRTDALYKNSFALEVLEESQRFDAKDTECVNLKGVDGDSGHPTDQLDVTLFNKKNGNHKEGGGDFGCLTRSNGFACRDSIIHFEDGPCDSSDLGGGVPSSETNMPSEDGTPNSVGNVKVKLSSNMSPSLRISAGVVCVYRCCSECVFNLHCLMKKVVLNQPKLKESNWTIEDLDDVVGSLSVNLHSAVRLAENSINLFDNNLEHVSDMGMCGCIKSVNRLIMPKECSCHSRSESGTVKAISYRNLRHGLDSVFTYRDGVLGVVDTERDVSFHCKFETLCLCSLIEWIIMNKQPSD